MVVSGAVRVVGSELLPHHKIAPHHKMWWLTNLIDPTDHKRLGDYSTVVTPVSMTNRRCCANSQSHDVDDVAHGTDRHGRRCKIAGPESSPPRQFGAFEVRSDLVRNLVSSIHVLHRRQLTGAPYGHRPVGRKRYKAVDFSVHRVWTDREQPETARQRGSGCPHIHRPGRPRPASSVRRRRCRRECR